MTDTEKAISLLQQCLDERPYAAVRVSQIMSCIQEAVELLKEQEPKVLTREELKQFDERPCWFESHGTYMGQKGFWIIPYMFTCYETMYYVYPLMQTNDRGDCHWSELGLFAYNKAWRCWSSKPTDEQREAVKWE